MLTPTNIVAAAFVAQIAIFAILVVATLIVTFRTGDNSGGFAAWLILIGFLLTIVLLVGTQELSNLWKPVFQGTPLSGLKLRTALMWIFGADTLLVSSLVLLSGGSHASPYTPVYFLLPVLAIFLREAPSQVIAYTTLVSVMFTFTLAGRVHVIGPGGEVGEKRRRIAYGFVSVAALLLATWIGLITRPM